MHQPLVQEINYQAPHELFVHFATCSWSMFLDSSMPLSELGCYSFIVIDPFTTVQSKNNTVHIKSVQGEQIIQANPFDILQNELKKYLFTTNADLPPFQGGAVGYLGYDLCHHLEHFTYKAQDDMEFSDLAIGFYDLVIGFDVDLKKAWIFSSGFPECAPQRRVQRARDRIVWLNKEIANQRANTISNISLTSQSIVSNFNVETYQDAVRTVIDYIYEGDVYEVNIAQRFAGPLPDHVAPYTLYQQLYKINPAPFSAYLNIDDTIIASASPERFLSVQNGKVESRPIKGTRRRGATPGEDKRLAQELLTSEKDRCENIMIVDLMRNDLSKVCVAYSVQVPQLCALESFPTVHHLVSVITGQLKSDVGPIDLLKAAFPGGSVTGTPKIRAMEIIAELEPTARGPYCGSIGYIGFNSNMDTSIVIRTFCIKNNIVTFQAGGAIVADSNPFDEYEETLSKAKALRSAYEQIV